MKPGFRRSPAGDNDAGLNGSVFGSGGLAEESEYGLGSHVGLGQG